MKRPPVALLLCLASITLVSHAHADRIHSKTMRALSTAITVPSDWAGVWAVHDSVYDCNGVFQEVSADTDTICGGEGFEDPSTSYTCSGTATSTTVNVTCNASTPVGKIPDCNVVSVITFVGTRSGSSYRNVVTVQASYSGTGFGCNLLPPFCERTVSYGTKIGAAPGAYCLTSTLPMTWGTLKTIYR